MIGAPHLAVAHEPELDRCIRETHAGQAAWPAGARPTSMRAEWRHFRPVRATRTRATAGAISKLMPRKLRRSTISGEGERRAESSRHDRARPAVRRLRQVRHALL